MKIQIKKKTFINNRINYAQRSLLYYKIKTLQIVEILIRNIDMFNNN